MSNRVANLKKKLIIEVYINILHIKYYNMDTKYTMLEESLLNKCCNRKNCYHLSEKTKIW